MQELQNGPPAARTEHMKVNCENGCFNNSADFDQGDYSWGVEKVLECEWY